MNRIIDWIDSLADDGERAFFTIIILAALAIICVGAIGGIARTIVDATHTVSCGK